MKTSKTLKEIISFLKNANHLKSGINLKETKLGLKMEYAMAKLGKTLNPLTEEYNEKMNFKRIELCLVDKDGAVIHDEKGGYKFDRKGMQELSVYSETLLKETHEFTPHFILPLKELALDMAMLFEGFIIESIEEPK